MSSEFEKIARLTSRLGGVRPEAVTIGIGDDCAALRLKSTAAELVWTVDACVQDVHFTTEIASWQDVGWRSLMAAVSDVAAMGGSALGVLSSLELPRHFSDQFLEELVEGQRLASELVDSPVIGGNLSTGPHVAVHSTVLGRCERKPVRRSGAEPGDWVLLAGRVGWAAAGLRLLLEGGASWTPASEVQDQAVRAWRRPVALMEAGRAASRVAHAMIDVSDGLAQDAGHVAVASGVRVVIEPDLLADERLERVACDVGRDAIDLILGGGEDYALLVAAPAGTTIEGFRRIGRCEEGQGVWLEGSDKRLDSAGHDHFR